jgi:hypothetical protein
MGSIDTLSEFLTLPTEVAANRDWSGTISGELILTRLGPSLASEDMIELRILLEDFHLVRVSTESLLISKTELSRIESR